MIDEGMYIHFTNLNFQKTTHLPKSKFRAILRPIKVLRKSGKGGIVEAKMLGTPNQTKLGTFAQLGAP